MSGYKNLDDLKKKYTRPNGDFDYSRKVCGNFGRKYERW